MKKFAINLIVFLIFLLLGFLYYYIYLPVINVHSPDLWIFVISIIFIATAVYKVLNFRTAKKGVIKAGIIIGSILITIFIIGAILSSPIINAKKYQSLITIEDRDFKIDIPQISYSEIPVLDKETAINLGSREMGSLIDMVSQFEVNTLYSQINYNQKPTRVTPLAYGNFFKWITNRKYGLPGYMKIDMTTQDVELIKFENGGMKYSFSEPFNRNVKRYLRFNYPTYIFDEINFEIDDTGTPFWICPIRTYSIGLFGGPTIKKVVLLNALTGKLEEYNVKEVPQWIDKVYPANLLISYFNYYGTLKNGYFNSIFSQKGVLKTTDGYNYIALDDDVWVYTGVTSVGADMSNVGFVLMNQRTAETRYYTISGAQETSAMASAQGQVQHLKYVATFPLLLNISNQPTYFMALKDEAGLVKSYAMVNVEKYQIVAIGSTIAECEQNYINLFKGNNIQDTESLQTDSITGKIKSINQIIIDGNTYYFLKLDSSNEFFAILVKDNIDILNYALESTIFMEYSSLDDYNIVSKIVK